MEQNESHIISRILAGRTEEFAYFLDTYGQVVFSLLVRMVETEEDAEELTQDVFMKAFTHLGSFYGKSSFSTWIYRIAYNTGMSFLRKRPVEEAAFDDRFWAPVSDTQVDEALDDTSGDRVEQLGQALKRLSPDERVLIALYYEEERPLREVAKIMGLTESNAKVRLHRIRKKLYLLMQEEE